MSDLDRMFSEYDERKKREKEVADQKHLQERDLRQQTIDVLKSKVVPILKEISITIQQKGHTSSVIERFDPYSYPHVELSFTPVLGEDERHAYVSPSILRFVHTDSGHIEVKQEINTKGGKRSPHYSGSNVQFSLLDLTEDKTRVQALSFLEAVLKVT